MGLHACYCCYVVIVIVGIVVIVVIVIVAIVVRAYVCMLLLMMVALVFSHPTRHETMKLLLASATSLVTRVLVLSQSYGRLKKCQAQRANQAPTAGAKNATRHSTSTAPKLALDGRLPLHWPVEPGNF